MDDHIHTCEACRNLLAVGEPLDAAWSAWVAAVNGGAESPAIQGRFQRLLPRIAAAALAGLVVAAVFLWPHSASKAPRVDGRQSELTRGVPKQEHSESTLEPAAPVVVLRDGKEPLTLDREGRLYGLEALPGTWRRQVATALRTRRLERPAVLAKLLSPPSSVLRSPTDLPEMTPFSPVATVVRANTPTFRWRPLPGAESYRVTVFDQEYRRIAESGPLRASFWIPAEPLPDARVLVWQVAAHRGGEEIMAPRPPAPEARFQILDRTRVTELANAARGHEDSHLALAVLYADAGLVEEALSELQALEKLNQGSEVAGDLLRSIRSWSRAGQLGQLPSPSSTNPAQ